MLAKSLEKILNDLFLKARSEGAEFVGVEHLLRALLDDSECRDVLDAAGGAIEQIERTLDDHIASLRSDAAQRRHADVVPTFGFQRALQGAVSHVQRSGRTEVGSIDVLVSLFSERESTAVRILAVQGIERKDLLEQLGETSWNAPANASIATAVAGCSISSDGVLSVTASRSRIENRLDSLEAKLDVAMGEFRDISAKLTRLIEGLPPIN